VSTSKSSDDGSLALHTHLTWTYQYDLKTLGFLSVSFSPFHTYTRHMIWHLILALGLAHTYEELPFL
jgi:hypothetical protein